MGSMGIVVDPPSFDLGARVRDRHELRDVQTLIAQAPIKRFYVPVLRRLSRVDEVELHTPLIRPVLERSGSELRSVIYGDRYRRTGSLDRSIQGRELAFPRTTDRGRNPCSSAHACASPEGRAHGADTCACAGAPACAAASLPADTSDRRASCSLASLLGAASRGSSDNQIGAGRAQSRECAAAAPTDHARCSSHTTPNARSWRAARPCAPSPRSAPKSTGPAHGVALASELFSDHLAQDVLIEREVGHQALEARVLIAQLAELADLGEPELRVLLLPQVKARLAHPELPAYICHRRPAFRLAQRHGNLLVGKSLALHGPRLPFRRTSEVSLVQF